MYEFFNKKTKKDVFNDNTNCDYFINSLPDISKMKEIISKQYFSSKDLLPMKLVLDIYMHYFNLNDLPLLNKLSKEIIPLQIMFYNSLSEVQINLIYNIINKDKELKKCKILIINSNKKEYLDFFKNMLHESELLSSGVQENHFIQ